MKNLLLGLLFASSFLTSAQSNLSMTPEVEKYVLSYINEGLSRDINIVDSLFKKVDSIIIDEKLQYPILGYFNKRNKSIHIASFTLVDTLVMKTTIYHELTHALIGRYFHTCRQCSDIMSEGHPYTFSIYAKEEDWQKEVDKLFDLIKEN